MKNDILRRSRRGLLNCLLLAAALFAHAAIGADTVRQDAFPLPEGL
jgi:hypothetical protein